MKASLTVTYGKSRLELMTREHCLPRECGHPQEMKTGLKIKVPHDTSKVKG